jgi:hypothetical protein
MGKPVDLAGQRNPPACGNAAAITLSERAILKVGDCRAEVHFHRDHRGAVVVERMINLDHGIPINVTTQAGTAFDILAAACAACIERGDVEKQRGKEVAKV